MLQCYCERSVDVQMTLIWAVPEHHPPSPSHEKMRLVEPAALSNSSRLKSPYVGIPADSVIRLFCLFLRFHIDVHT